MLKSVKLLPRFVSNIRFTDLKETGFILKPSFWCANREVTRNGRNKEKEVKMKERNGFP